MTSEKTDCSIEDLFSAADLVGGFEGKPFNFSDEEVDRTTFADKACFAHDFVAKKAAELDWKGFHTLLGNIDAAFKDYQRRLKEI
ncbi:hypothetical protein BTM36_12140 [Herbaspirillum sp. VT-16-41]|nr:hypothetical protein BTM36_12140 [Herbaspirillum sp. VT-16-41]